MDVLRQEEKKPLWRRKWLALPILGIVVVILIVNSSFGNADYVVDKDRVTAVYDRLDALLARRRYLVGDRFSRADLTLAALAAPTWRPPQHSTRWPPDDLYPEELTAFRARFANTRTREHVLRMYREHRAPQVDDDRADVLGAAPPVSLPALGGAG